MRKAAEILLNAVVADTDGDAVAVENYEDFTVYIEAASVTDGATVSIQSKAPSGTWMDIDTRAIGANGNTVVAFSGAHQQIRARVTSRTDGTFTVGLNARGDR